MYLVSSRKATRPDLCPEKVMLAVERKTDRMELG